jgi:hypothetical protein
MVPWFARLPVRQFYSQLEAQTADAIWPDARSASLATNVCPNEACGNTSDMLRIHGNSAEEKIQAGRWSGLIESPDADLHSAHHEHWSEHNLSLRASYTVPSAGIGPRHFGLAQSPFPKPLARCIRSRSTVIYSIRT